MEFLRFPSIPRLSRECTITEKLDGACHQVAIDIDGETLQLGSREMWLDGKSDSEGFWEWAHEHLDALFTLGPGRHHGEWWGQGIGRGYGLQERRFSLYNTTRFCLYGSAPKLLKSVKGVDVFQDMLPPCIGLVPELYRGVFSTEAVDVCLEDLRVNGSRAVPGFMRPEGVVIYHIQGNCGFKKTLDKHDQHKGSK